MINNRNYGIDLLKILSMYMIVILHVLGCGGILESAPKYSITYYTYWFIEALSYCAVDVFAIISGYLLVTRKIEIKKITNLWFTVFFYCLCINLAYYIYSNTQDVITFGIRELVYSIFFPVISRQYWYFSCYFSMYFFLPFINKGLNVLTKEEYKRLCFTIIVLFSLLPIISMKRYDSFNLNYGYSTLWLICCYIIGGYLNRFSLNIPKKKCGLLFLFSIFLSWFSKLISHFLLLKIFKINTEVDIFIDYTSIFIIIASISLFILFSNIRIKSNKSMIIVSFLSSISFSVYIIHTNPIIFNNYLHNRFVFILDKNIFIGIFLVYFVSLLIFIFCIILDLLRVGLFCMIKKIIKKFNMQKNASN